MLGDLFWLLALWRVLRLCTAWYVIVLFLLTAGGLLWIAVFGGALLENALRPHGLPALLQTDLPNGYVLAFFWAVLILITAMVSLLLSKKARNAVLGSGPRYFYPENRV